MIDLVDLQGDDMALVQPTPNARDNRDSIRAARRAVEILALIGAGILALPHSAGAQVDGDACGVFVVSSPRPSDPDPLTCSPGHHHEWWSECAHAILEARPRPESGPNDPWSLGPLGPWAPDDRFAERFVAECEALRSVAKAEERPMLEPKRTAPHDASQCPCTTAEHQAWVEGCLAEIDAILPGMRRWEVMERLGRDGGLSMASKTRLRHCACRLLKVDVEFDVPPGQWGESPRDLVRSVGDPYLEYPISD